MEQITKDIRKNIITIANLAKSPHVGSALSCADILATLYHKVMNISLPLCEDRDYFLLSKAHSAMCLYSTLNSKGFLSDEDMLGYYQNGGKLPAHTDRLTNDFIEISAGSLGHGLPIGLGIAKSLKLDKKDSRVFVLMGDGESQEGSVWEAAMLAPALGLDNITAIIDYNNLQGYGRARELVSYEPIKDKWESFGWETVCIDGHDYEQLEEALSKKSNKPKIVICNTTKGKGVSFMEDELIWHYYLVTDEIKQKAMEELS
ncbi:MAG: transketolase [Denitrovibrio sp.]|nr:MAG: transketolase [Denitrovibrio sp.]